jgi:amino-acid N-acetyltransferase
MNNDNTQVDLIREAFHYQSRFDGSTMVFKIDFLVMEDPGFPYLVKDLALLARTGFRVVIVPGAKEWIDSVLAEHGIESVYADVPSSIAGRAVSARVTTAEAMPFVEMAAFNVAARFMTGLSASRVEAVIGNFVRARGMGVVNGADMEHTGTVDKIYTESIGKALSQNMVPILPCIGYSPSGKPYNVPSGEIALAASTALGAIKLFVVTVNEGLRAERFHLPENLETGGRLVRLTPQEGAAVLEANAGRTDKPLEELALALRACRAGVDRVHIIDGREDGAILRELFSNLGAGTMVYTDEYESIRNLRSKDIPDILRLMEPLTQQGNLVRRGPEQIQEKKEDYVVFEIDGSVRACGALHDWGETQGEIAAVATDSLFADMGLGRRIVGFLVDRAKKRGMSRVFVLTTRTHDWFEALGFKEASQESLPGRKRKLYDQNRRSKVFALEIGR